MAPAMVVVSVSDVVFLRQGNWNPSARGADRLTT
jgi:hypothetical protein